MSHSQFFLLAALSVVLACVSGSMLVFYKVGLLELKEGKRVSPVGPGLAGVALGVFGLSVACIYGPFTIVAR